MHLLHREFSSLLVAGTPWQFGQKEIGFSDVVFSIELLRYYGILAQQAVGASGVALEPRRDSGDRRSDVD